MMAANSVHGLGGSVGRSAMALGMQQLENQNVGLTKLGTPKMR